MANWKKIGTLSKFDTCNTPTEGLGLQFHWTCRVSKIRFKLGNPFWYLTSSVKGFKRIVILSSNFLGKDLFEASIFYSADKTSIEYFLTPV